MQDYLSIYLSKQLLFVTFSDTTAGIGASFLTDTHGRWTEGQTGVEAEIVIELKIRT